MTLNEQAIARSKRRIWALECCVDLTEWCGNFEAANEHRYELEQERAVLGNLTGVGKKTWRAKGDE